MRSMLVAPSGERQLVELKVVDAAWPLVGEAAVESQPPPPTPSREGRGSIAPELPLPLREGVGGGGRPGSIAAALSDHGLLAEPVVLDRLNLHPGDTVRLGNASFTVRGALISEPDRVAAPLILGPRVLIAADALASTGLIAPGSMVQYAVRATLPDPPPRPLCRRSARRLPRPGLAHPRSARRRARRHPLHRPDQPVHDAGRPDLAAGRRHRRRQRRARLARRPRAHHRDAALSRRLLRPGVCRLPDPGPGARALRHRHRACGRARWRRSRWLPGSRTCCRCRRSSASIPVRSLLAAGYGLLTALAFSLWPLGRAARIPGGGAVPRRADPRANPPVAPVAGGQRCRRSGLIALTIATAADRRFALWFCAAALAR